MSKLLSIISISKNNLKGLEKTLDSIFDLKTDEIELICVDGNSSDGSINLLRKNSEHIEHLIIEDDNGISEAYNKGIKCATGQWLWFINSGDYPNKEGFSELLATLKRTDAEIVYGHIQYIEGKRVKQIDKANLKQLKFKMSLKHPATIVRSSVFDKIGFFSQEFKIALDYEFFLRVLKNNFQFKACDAVLAFMDDSGISQSNWKRGIKESLLAKRIHNPSLLDFAFYFKELLVISIKRSLLS